MEIIDRTAYDNATSRLRDAGVVLPTFAELAEPWTMPAGVRGRLADVAPDEPHPANLFRVHWYNGADRRRLVDLPVYLELPSALTGTRARIVVLLGENFPLMTAHKVLAAYACLVPRLVSGRFDPAVHRAIWPSTGNYCRGGVAISRILGCRGVAVLPEGMSRERFDWLEQWVADPDDIIRTPGTESNVKEIYDKCAELAADERNVIINQFSEFGNYLSHYHCTGRAASHVFQSLGDGLQLAAFVAASGSAGTLGAGDYLKERHGAGVVAVEAMECPTLLCNGYGEHNIQGIGDKHVPLIHNVMNTDVIVGISDRSSDGAYLVFNTPEGRDYLAHRRKVPMETVLALRSLGLSGIANVLAAIKVARHFDLEEDSVVMTVGTDNASLYESQIAEFVDARFSGRFDLVSAGEVFGEHVAAIGGSRLLELTREDRLRIFNLGYYTWVEQQNVPVFDFDARKRQDFWLGLRRNLAEWDELIKAFNAETGLG